MLHGDCICIYVCMYMSNNRNASIFSVGAALFAHTVPVKSERCTRLQSGGGDHGGYVRSNTEVVVASKGREYWRDVHPTTGKADSAAGK